MRRRTLLLAATSSGIAVATGAQAFTGTQASAMAAGQTTAIAAQGRAPYGAQSQLVEEMLKEVDTLVEHFRYLLNEPSSRSHVHEMSTGVSNIQFRLGLAAGNVGRRAGTILGATVQTYENKPQVMRLELCGDKTAVEAMRLALAHHKFQGASLLALRRERFHISADIRVQKRYCVST